MSQRDPFLLSPEECDKAAAAALISCETLPDSWQKTAALADARHYLRVAEIKRWMDDGVPHPPE